MKERVAKVLFGWMHGHDRWDDAQPEEREDCIEAASAVIEQMREPTEAMLEAGQRANNLDETPGHFEFLSHDEMTEAWHAMIDEALK